MPTKGFDYVLTRKARNAVKAKAMAELNGCGIATVLAADTDVKVSVVSAAILAGFNQKKREPSLENSEDGSLYKT